MIRPFRSRTDNTHLSAQHVPELGEFVQAGSPKKCPKELTVVDSSCDQNLPCPTPSSFIDRNLNIQNAFHQSHPEPGGRNRPGGCQLVTRQAECTGPARTIPGQPTRPPNPVIRLITKFHPYNGDPCKRNHGRPSNISASARKLTNSHIAGKAFTSTMVVERAWQHFLDPSLILRRKTDERRCRYPTAPLLQIVVPRPTGHYRQ